MKTFIILSVVCLVGNICGLELKLSGEDKVKFEEHFKTCIKKENISEDDAARLRKKDFANPTENIKCFSKCFFERIGALKDGVLQEDMISQKLNPLIGEEQTKTILNKCKDMKGEGHCDTSFKTYACFEKSIKEL